MNSATRGYLYSPFSKGRRHLFQGVHGHADVPFQFLGLHLGGGVVIDHGRPAQHLQSLLLQLGHQLGQLLRHSERKVPGTARAA